MLISVPRLTAGATAHAIVTAEVTTRPILPPEKTDDLKIPKKIPRKLRIYTNGSPYIEIKHQRIRSLSKEIMDDGRRLGHRLGKDRSDLRRRAEEDRVRRRPGQRRGRSAPRRPGRLPGPLGRVHRPLPGQQDSGPHGLGPRPLLPRVLPGARRGRRATGTRANRPARGRSARCRWPGRSCKRATTSACPSGKKSSATPRTSSIGLPTPGGGKPKVKYIREIEAAVSAARKRRRLAQ